MDGVYLLYFFAFIASKQLNWSSASSFCTFWKREEAEAGVNMQGRQSEVYRNLCEADVLCVALDLSNQPMELKL